MVDTFSIQGKYTKADPLYERALKIYEETLGTHHPRVAETLRNMARLKYDKGEFETAAKLYKRATEIRENEGNTYTNKLMSRRNSIGEASVLHNNQMSSSQTGLS